MDTGVLFSIEIEISVATFIKGDKTNNGQNFNLNREIDLT